MYKFENIIDMIDNKIELDYFDENGYPTDEALEILENWDCANPIGWLDFAKSLWCYPDYVYFSKVEFFDEIKDVINFSTGGFAGNDSIIMAMSYNRVLWSMQWYFSKRGGFYSFFYDDPI